MFQAHGYYRTHGTGSAKCNLEKQIPGIEANFPEIRNFYHATVNVRFEPRIIVAGYDHRTAPIRWAKEMQQGEVFDLVRVRLNFGPLNNWHSALMYVAHWSPHRLDPHKHEFLIEGFVEGLQENMVVVMACDRASVELPYAACGRGGNGRPRFAKTYVIL